MMGFGISQVAGVAVFLGALAAGVLGRMWRLEVPSVVECGRCLVGGFVMQTGAQCIPGGTDSWLLWTIPGGGIHGLIAYAVSLVILLGWWRLEASRKARG
jgi:hypothetical protein